MTAKSKNGQLRAALSKKMKKRGELNAFCERNKLSYNYVYRVAKGLIPQPSYEQACAIQAALDSEEATQKLAS